jgi:hypothetical protein
MDEVSLDSLYGALVARLVGFGTMVMFDLGNGILEPRSVTGQRVSVQTIFGLLATFLDMLDNVFQQGNGIVGTILPDQGLDQAWGDTVMIELAVFDIEAIIRQE